MQWDCSVRSSFSRRTKAGHVMHWAGLLCPLTEACLKHPEFRKICIQKTSMPFTVPRIVSFQNRKVEEEWHLEKWRNKSWKVHPSHYRLVVPRSCVKIKVLSRMTSYWPHFLLTYSRLTLSFLVLHPIIIKILEPNPISDSSMGFKAPQGFHS